MEWWQALLTGAGVAGAVVALIVWLVRQIVTSSQKNAAALAEAAKLRADEAIAAALAASQAAIAAAEANATARIDAAVKAADAVVAAKTEAADNRVHDSDLRANEWKETAGVFENALQQQRDIAQKALEVNQMTDRYFGSFRAVAPHTGDNALEVKGA